MKSLLSLLLLCCWIELSAQQPADFRYQTGDLLFQDLDCGELCDAIEAVTPEWEGKRFSHVGLVYVAGDSIYVIEAIGKDVHITSIVSFLQRQLDNQQRPKVIAGRLKEAYKHLNAKAVGFALKQIGKPYDEDFIYDNGKYYCSELVYDAFKEANGGNPFFHLYPMTFKQPGTNKTFPAWKTYFKARSTKIPEGKPGCNPASILLNNNVKVIAAFY